MQRLNVEFRSEGVALRGWLYLPEARAERPAIVMTHGFSGVKEQYLDRYAEVFAAAGFVVLLYDHPNFGDSDGEPRQEIDPVMQRRGYRDAITWLGAQARVDASRIGIWGTSYSGGHVLEVAALDRRVKCVVAQVPTVSGHASALRRTRAEQLPALLASFDADRQRRFEDLLPALLPAVAAGPDEPCAMAGADAHRFFTDSAALAPNWCNRVTLRSAELARENEPGIHMARISPTPLLMIVADRDLLTPTDLCLEAYQRALPPKRLLMLAGGHFTPYIEHFDATSQAAADWFVRHLGEGGEQSATVVE
ncbi:TPA: alpha/beta hydrolase [Pseudomonas aeruginosa]|uniref:alpha/beta hydrolase n=1 Tax=Pseudomonas aeruginosa TaxID=287 RepID=UPI00053E4ABD|nr:alpha/beta hydrolase [Pseudomonas aeruginosa]MBH9068099.1 alpha/beta hydrolase [Pseudomonas aeruginosa]